MLRILIAANLLSLATFSEVHAANLGCNPAVQNWVNGSGMTCPFDSNAAAIQPAAPAPIPVVAPEVDETPPPPPPVED
jgi:hypothetical protein